MRQILADTNLPIAAVGWPHGVPAQALWRIVTEEHLVLTTYIIDKFLDVIVTGGKDFHALTIASPSVFTPRQYLDTGAPRT